MARSLSAKVIADVTGLSGSQMLVMLEVTLTDSTVIRMVRDHADVTFEGNTYTKVPFSIEALQQDVKGAPADLVVKISNAHRTLMPYLEAGGGGVGATVRLLFVHVDNLALNIAEIDETYLAIDCYADAQWVHWTLGAASVHARRFPKHKFMMGICRNTFKDPWCGYTGSETECNRTFDRCRELGNQERFGGFPAMVPDRIYSL